MNTMIMMYFSIKNLATYRQEHGNVGGSNRERLQAL